MSLGWSLVGALSPNTANYVANAYRRQDRLQFFEDHHKNTGRYIKYSYMRGFNPSMNYLEQGVDSAYYLRRNFGAGLNALNTATGGRIYGMYNPDWGTPISTTRNVMELW